MFISTTPQHSAGSDAPPNATLSSGSAARAVEGGAQSLSNALVASDQLFRALFDAAPLAIGITRGFVLLYANPALVALMGLPEGTELSGRSVHDFVDPTQNINKVERPGAEKASQSHATLYELTIFRSDGARIPVRSEVTPISLPDGPAVISFVFDLSEELRATHDNHEFIKREQRSAHFARQLQQLTSALLQASSPDEVASICLEHCVGSVGAFGGVFVVPREDETGTLLYLLQSRGYSAEAVAGWKTMRLDALTPITEAYCSEEAVWIDDIGAPEHAQRFPVLASAGKGTGSKALVTLPLRLDAHVLGVLGLTFDTPRKFDEEDRLFMETLAASCAQALERARLDAEGREMARRQRESLALLNTLLDSAPVGFCLFDRDHRYVLVNEELARINSIEIEGHIGLRPSEIMGVIGQEVEFLLEQVWESGLPSGEVNFTKGPPEDRTEFRHCSLALYPIRVGGLDAKSGEMLGVGAILIEQTERVRGEMERGRLFDQLEIERARFEAILQQMPSGVVIADAPSGELVLNNERVGQIWRHAYLGPDKVAQYPAYTGFHPDGHQLQPEEWPLARAVTYGEVVSGEEIEIERGDGERGIIRVNAAPIRDQDNNITAGIVVFDDVTDRARAEASQRFLAEVGSILVSVQDEPETFRAVASLCVPSNADLCVFVVPDNDNTLNVFALEHSTGADKTKEEQWKEWLGDTPTVRQKIAGAMQTQRATFCTPSEFGTSLAQLEINSVLVAPITARGRSIGAMLWLNLDSKRPFDADHLQLAEELARRMGLSVDNARLLQEAQQARDAAQRARDEAESANRAKDEFLAVVSHELRTPLTPILGWLELLRAPGIDESLRTQAYDVIERNAMAQAQLVNDILDVSRITTGKLRLELKDISLEGVVTGAVEALRTVWDSKHLTVELNVEPRLLVRGDPQRLGQIVWNLLQNAIKFTPEGGSIQVTLKKSDQQENGPKAYLEVRDTGAGMEPELISHIFERFRQGDSSSTRTTGGLGLGLAIVKHIAELHGGNVGAQSQGRGHGATFWVELPLLDPVDTTTLFSPFPRSRSMEGKLKGARVLVVDDEPDTREMLARLLEEAGATVRVASGGNMALEVVVQFAPSVIVSDIGMPGMDGFALRRELLSRGFRMPAIALTAYTSGKDQAMAYEAGYERHLSKPVGTQELIDIVAQILHP